MMKNVQDTNQIGLDTSDNLTIINLLDQVT